MQLAPITHPKVVQTGPWVRQRMNLRLYRIVNQPITDLYGTIHDAWVMEDYVRPDGRMGRRPAYKPDAVWRAALVESNRRLDLYCRLVPLSQWGI